MSDNEKKDNDSGAIKPTAPATVPARDLDALETLEESDLVQEYWQKKSWAAAQSLGDNEKGPATPRK